MLYLDGSKAIEDRVEDLLSHMELEEKVMQLCSIFPIMLQTNQKLDPKKMEIHLGKGLGRITQFQMLDYQSSAKLAEFANEIQSYVLEHTRLKIPVILQTEAASGFVGAGATNFPTPIALASTWKPGLMEKIARVIGEEMQAAGVRQALAPVLDIARDARWGRIHETFGEDPYLVSAMGTAFVSGLQAKQRGVMATAKHFLGYSLAEGGLNLASVHLGRRELYEVFARPFEAAIKEADLAAVMTSYAEIDGIPCTCSKEVVTDLLRNTMGFDGVVISDGAALKKLVTAYGVARNMEEAGIYALEAGLNAEIPVGDGFRRLTGAVEKGLVEPTLIDQAVRFILKAKFTYGLFEQPYVQAGKVCEIYSRTESQELAKQAAKDSMILLKNDGLLPLGNQIQSIAVIGPHGDSVRCMFSGYTHVAICEVQSILENAMKNKIQPADITFNGLADEVAKDSSMVEKSNVSGDMEETIRQLYQTKSIKEAFAETMPHCQIECAKGCEITEACLDGFTEAVKAAEAADVVILAIGGKGGWSPDCTYGEGKDQASLRLPGVQQQLLETIKKCDKPMVVVVFGGGTYDLTWAESYANAILLAWHPGQAGGTAIVDTLLGKASPGGRLPITFPRSAGQVPQYYYHKAGSGYQPLPENEDFFFGAGYVNEKLEPLYPFGYGLSYTQFAYQGLQISEKQVDSTGEVAISFTIKNIGTIPGDEVVQLYLAVQRPKVARPVKQLAGFKRISLAAREEKSVTFHVPMSLLAYYNDRMEFVVEPGKVEVMIGSNSIDVSLQSSFAVIGEKVAVMGRRSYFSESQ